MLKVTLNKSKPHPSVLLAPCLLASLHPALTKVWASLWQVLTHSHKTNDFKPFSLLLGAAFPLWWALKQAGSTEGSEVMRRQEVRLKLPGLIYPSLSKRHLIRFQSLMSLIWDTSNTLSALPFQTLILYSLYSLHTHRLIPSLSPTGSGPGPGQGKKRVEGRGRLVGGVEECSEPVLHLNLTSMCPKTDVAISTRAQHQKEQRSVKLV